jgi:hypothetical protein
MSTQRPRLIALAALALPLVAADPAPAQIGDWSLAGTMKVTVTARGRTVQRAQRFGGIRLVIEADGTYRQPGTLLCGSGEIYNDVAEVGTWEAAGMRFLLRPTNLDDLIPLVLDCVDTGYDIGLTLHTYYHQVKPVLGGARLRGRTIMRGRLEIYDLDLSAPFRVIARYRGTPAAADPGTLAPALATWSVPDGGNLTELSTAAIRDLAR